MLEDACKEMGLSDEAAEQITTAYGKQAEEKINKVNSMVEFVAKQVKIEREKFYQEHGEPAYRVGSSPARNTTGKDSVEVNKESNSDIYLKLSLFMWFAMAGLILSGKVNKAEIVDAGE